MTSTAPTTTAGADRPELPTNRAEDWRYAPLRAITAAADAATAAASAPVGSADLDALLADLPGGDRIVLVNGRYSEALSSPAAIRAVDVDGDPDRDAIPPRDGFDAWNRLATTRVMRVRVDRTGPGAGAPVHLVHLGTPGEGPAHPRVEVVVDAAATLSVVETFRATPGVTFTNATTTIRAGADSRVEHLVVLDEPERSAHVVRTDVVAEERARVTVGVAALGGGGHHRLDVELAGAGAEVTLTGLTVSSRGAHHDTLAAVHHVASHGTSRQQFASVVADGARSSFTGQVVVAHGTVGTDADQQDRNLLLGPTARADTRPWLEIHSDDVACTHGATVGRLDEEGVFYLRSRGIPQRDARTMLMRAFATTVVERLASSEDVRSWVDAAVTAAIDEIVDGERPTGEGAR